MKIKNIIILSLILALLIVLRMFQVEINVNKKYQQFFEDNAPLFDWRE